MKSSKVPLLLAILALVALTAIAANAAASHFGARLPPDHSEVPAGAPLLVGGAKAVCTPRKCRFPMTCTKATDPSYETPCLPLVSLWWRDGPLTKSECKLYKETGEPVDPIPEADGQVVHQGETKTLILETFSLRVYVDFGRKAIKRALREGKRKLPGGEFNSSRGAEFNAFDIPGEFVNECAPSEHEPVKIRIKR